VARSGRIQPSPWQIKKNIRKLYLDLSSIAKGYAVDFVYQFIESKGIRHYMVEIGGEVRTRGKNKSGQNWQIGIEVPIQSNLVTAPKPFAIVELSDKSLATSGDYRNYFQIEKKFYSHTINPVTGKPIEHKLASVSVIHKSCMIADGWATALLVLGPEKGYEIAQREKLEALFIIRQGINLSEMDLKKNLLVKKTELFTKNKVQYLY
jgi:thiamine biosynthesis lipoprotein